MIRNADPSYLSNNVPGNIRHSFDPFSGRGCLLRLQSGEATEILQPRRGCNVVIGTSSSVPTFICPGPSDQTVLDHLPDLDLYMVANNSTCAEIFKTIMTDGSRIVVGDPEDAKIINDFTDKTISDTPSPRPVQEIPSINPVARWSVVPPQFDIIIDHVGHSVNQRVTSLRHL
ncbi:hypothetical protein ACHAPJ_004547 [Fusarium lateritium]